MKSVSSQAKEVSIVPVTPWGFPDFRELFAYRDLIYYIVWRNLKVAYAQSVGGLAWAIIQPAFQVLVFSLVFGGLLSIDTGGIPYPLFSTVAVIPWTYMSAAMTTGSSGLVNNVGMLGKVYFPRLVFLLTPAIGGLINFVISLLFMMAVLLYFQVEITQKMLLLPALILLMIIVPLGITLWLSSLTIRFRDFRIVMGYLIRTLIYLVPVMYPSEQIPEHLRQWYIINPFVGVIEGFRSCLLNEPIYWDSLAWSVGVTIVLVISGAAYFKRMERIIVDVI